MPALSSLNKASVTKRFVIRFSAAAQCYPVPDFIDITIRRFNRNASADPVRAMFASGRVLDDNNGFFKFRFMCLSRFFIPDNKTPGRTVACLFYRNVPCLGIT
jgi:hypothetical protein